MEIRRFGTGHRRPDGPPGTRGVEAQPIHGDDRGTIAELALRPHAAISPHSNPNLTYLLVIEGGGWVAVGDERARVSAGDAVLWPPNVPHAAWTEITPMRAIVVEFAGSAAPEIPPELPPEIPRGAPAVTLESSPAAPRTVAATASASEGGLVPNLSTDPPGDRSSAEGEPW